jgi:hypothetical protein
MLSMVCFLDPRRLEVPLTCPSTGGTRWPTASEEPLVSPDSDVAL